MLEVTVHEVEIVVYCKKKQYSDILGVVESDY